MVMRLSKEKKFSIYFSEVGVAYNTPICLLHVQLKPYTIVPCLHKEDNNLDMEFAESVFSPRKCCLYNYFSPEVGLHSFVLSIIEKAVKMLDYITTVQVRMISPFEHPMQQRVQHDFQLTLSPTMPNFLHPRL